MVMKSIVITSTLLLFSVVGFSQQQRPEVKPPTPEQIAQRDTNALSERLSLTEDQRSKAYSVYLDRAKTQQSERESRLKEIQKQREQAVAQAKKQDERISQFLNEDQKKSYQQFKTQRQGPGRVANIRPNRFGQGGGRGFGANPRMQRFQRSGRTDLRFQRGQRPQLQQRGGPGFGGRPDMRMQLRRAPGADGPGQQFNGRPQRRDLQNGPQQRNFQFQNRPDSLRLQNRRAAPPAPVKPADKL